MKITKTILKEMIKQQLHNISESDIFKFITPPEDFNKNVQVNEDGELSGESQEQFQELADTLKSKIGDVSSILSDVMYDYSTSYKPESYIKMYSFLKMVDETHKAIENFRKGDIQ